MATTIDIIPGDLTHERTDAIVNAANSSLLGGGGVVGAIHRAAGPGLLAACRELRRTSLPDGLPVGEAVATKAFDLPCRWVIHTVGPNRHAGQTDPALLAGCFASSLSLAEELGARSIAFPAISAGIYGWDADDVARIALETTLQSEAVRAGRLDLVRFVLFGEPVLEAFLNAGERLNDR